MSLPSTETEIVVIGGGPAGATAARLLAEWGRSVVVLTRPESRTVEVGESLPPSIRKILDHVGVLDAIDAAGFYPTSGNTVWWESPEARVERFSVNRFGFQVSKRALERLLMQLAERAGAVVHRDTVVRVVDEKHGAPYSVRGERTGRNVVLTASWILDASGRAGVIARRGWRRTLDGTRTLALIASWTSPTGWDLEDESHTLVESYPGGWAWSVPVTRQTRFFTVMVDPRHTQVSSHAAIGALYAAELDRTRHLKTLLTRAVRDAEPWACDASPYTAERFGHPGVLLVGDAASFIDPLSSFGVKKAIASAWLAAIVAHTCLDFPDRTPGALELFESREQEIAGTYLRRSADFARAASHEHAHPFWLDRAQGDDDDPGNGRYDVETLRADPEVLCAFADLKARPTIQLAPGPAISFAHRPVVVGRYVELHDHLMLPGDVPIRFLRDVNLPALVRLGPDHDQVPDLFDAYNRNHPPVALPDFLGALSVLLARGALVHRSDRV